MKCQVNLLLSRSIKLLKIITSSYITHYSLFVAIRFADSPLFNDLIPTMDAVTSVW